MSSTSVALSSPARPGLLTRARAWARLHLPLLVAAATLALVWGGLLITHKPTPLVVPRTVALRAALSDSTAARMLRTVGYNRVAATPMDKRREILAFYRGERIVATVTVGSAGRPVILDAS